MKIGTKLRTIRDSLRYSTRDIAAKIGVSQSTYLGWEHDKFSPSLLMFNELAKALEVCPADLISYLNYSVKLEEIIERGRQRLSLNTALDMLQCSNQVLAKEKEELSRELSSLKMERPD